MVRDNISASTAAEHAVWKHPSTHYGLDAVLWETLSDADGAPHDTAALGAHIPAGMMRPMLHV